MVVNMNEIVKKDILSILKQSKRILQRKDSFMLRELSNHTIHNASIFQDEDSISIAVIIYSLSKVIERGKLDTRKTLSLINSAKRYLEKDDFMGYKKTIKYIFKFISRVDLKFKLYIEEVVKQAQIKKGSKLYDHGISIGQAADLLGISEWELMNYVGKTRIVDRFPSPDVEKRLVIAKELFGL